MDQEVKDARARLAAKFGETAQIGGKGKFLFFSKSDRLLRNSKKNQEEDPRSNSSYWRQEAQIILQEDR